MSKKRSARETKLRDAEPEPARKQWTLMFYFASDNPLAPGVVSQLKAIQNAGYQKDVNVIAHFDPATPGTPTHIFDVNLVERITNPQRPSHIGFTANDPFVRSLIKDKLWSDEKGRDGKTTIREAIQAALNEQAPEKKGAVQQTNLVYNPPIPLDVSEESDDGENEKADNSARVTGSSSVARKKAGKGVVATNGTKSNGDKNGLPGEPGPRASLRSFLKFCAENYQADHYALFILGHGVVVGNDVFLFDQDASEPTLSLIQLGVILTDFKTKFIRKGEEFELVSFHSCSVSSLEVAYELKGTANYMLASQGSAFVGSWPYRQILIRIFNDVEEKRLDNEDKEKQKKKIKRMLVKIFNYCLHNSTDFLLAGYPFDICLCSLDEEKVTALTTHIKDLAKALKDALKAEKDSKRNRVRTNFIQLAHLKSQSYWQESYTDLYDFCFCLSGYCESVNGKRKAVPAKLKAIHKACGAVMKKLAKESKGRRDQFIVRAQFAGPESQYSHGMSVYFPWAQPSVDNQIWSRPNEKFVGRYEQYKFEETGWRDFLQAYFDDTMRATRKDEKDKLGVNAEPDEGKTVLPRDLLEDIVSLVYSDHGRLSGDNALGGTKTTPPDPAGDSCTCPSIKNYPRDTSSQRRRGPQQACEKSPLLSKDFFKAGFK